MASLIFSYAIGIGAVVVAAGAGAMAALAVFDYLKQSGQERATKARLARVSEESADIGIGRFDAQVRAGSRMDWFLNGAIGGRFEARVLESGLKIPADVLLERMLASAVGLFIVASLALGNIIPGMVLAVAAIVVPYVWLASRAEARVEKMRMQLPDALTLLGNSLGSGLSVQQALEYAATETPNPLGGELWRLVHDVSAGMSLSESLDRFRATIPLRELQTVAAALEVQRRIGGNLREMLDQATQSVRESLELKMTLKSQTAQGRMSAKVVGFLPLILTGVIALFDPSYVAPFFTTPIGAFLFAIAMIAEVAGFMAIRRIVEIEV